MCFLIIVILYCSDETFTPHCWNHVGRESKVPPTGFPHIFRRAFSLGVAIPKHSDAAEVSSDCFPSLSVLREDRIPDWSGRSLARSYEMSGDGGVGWTWASWRDGNNLANWFLTHFFASADGVCIMISLLTYGLGLLTLWLESKDKRNCCRYRVLYCTPLSLFMDRTRSINYAA